MMEAIRSALAARGLDAIVLTDEKNRRYATGFHSTAGAVYISQKQAVFYTDFRYIEAARAAIHTAEVREIGGGRSYAGVVNDLIREDGAQRVALEDDCLTYADYRRWADSLKAEAVPQDGLMLSLRTVKTRDELDKIVRAQRIAERAFEEILNEIRPGVTEKKLAARLTYLMLHEGAENMSFDPIVVSGANSSKPHGVPSEKAVAVGDFVTMDFGCIYDGYCSDMTRTVAVGRADEEMRRVYENVLSAQRARTAQPVQHFSSDVLVSRVSAESENGQRRRLERSVERCLGQSLHLGKALGKCSKCEGLLLASDGIHGVLSGAFHSVAGALLELIKN